MSFSLNTYSIITWMSKGTINSKQARYLKFKWLERYSNHNHLVHKRTFNHLARLCLRTKCFFISVCLSVSLELIFFLFFKKSINICNYSKISNPLQVMISLIFYWFVPSFCLKTFLLFIIILPSSDCFSIFNLIGFFPLSRTILTIIWSLTSPTVF